MSRTRQDDTPTDVAVERSHDLSEVQIKRATRTRKIFALLSSFCLLLTVIFLILVEVGGTTTSSVRTQIYFINLDLSNIVPLSVPNAPLLNSIARTLGLHDFYRVYLWGFCEGYNGEGVTKCSDPETLYSFNPVEILRSELLAGASIQLPANINDILDLIRLVSHWMFGLFLSGAVLSFVLIFVVPWGIYSRWASLPISILAFTNALIITVACVIATVMFVIFKNVIAGVSELNIRASIGVEMFAFMWIASGFAIITWLIHLGQCCCCASRRDVRTGRRKGNKKAYEPSGNVGTEKPSSRMRRRFWKRSS
ncbi:integral membrane protein-like protein [Pseudovirgaria hyperparasitica]|uniref:Integral membrane protein-like protein n=1 Tax=Pseudovirgaria hyperparasitica TaxID=470096 RepID=A0A6A6WC66_9PEZI|nr:integral membrane protein-like protein [Pseudovirgaria hyperparasitica]KAF2759769.1 integral membrane protein-like protein [Pseudovirgaria hyperparasitica]